MRFGDELWNRCDVCGRFIALSAFDCCSRRRAVRNLIYPDSEVTRETWETLCPDHNPESERQVSPQHGEEGKEGQEGR